MVELQKPPGWHAQHVASACHLYGLSPCDRNKTWRIFNSGVMLLTSAQHAGLTRGWEAQPLACRILCDQLYLNAALRREGLAIHDWGATYNYVGSELRRAILSSEGAAARSAAEQAHRRAGLADACFLHLTRKVPKAYTAHWALFRAAHHRDVLQCRLNRTSEGAPAYADRRVGAALGGQLARYDIERELCKGQEEPAFCRLQPWARGAPPITDGTRSREHTERSHPHPRPFTPALASLTPGATHAARRGGAGSAGRSGRGGGGAALNTARVSESVAAVLLLETPPDHVPMAPDHLP